jgi:nucleoside-diphosphate-sugar epimerase
MRVLVTGGTGFLGGHSVARLIRSGHEVRLLVRAPARVEANLAPHDVSVSDVVVGDVTDRDSVAKAVAGCDAALHCAAVFSFDPRAAREMAASNARATEIVLGAASEAGCDPVVHVSTFAALLPSSVTLTPDAPVGTIRTTYSASKAASDRVARRFQEQGAPVVITYPGVVMGPHDPYMGESARLIYSILRRLVPFQLHGVFPVADVRYVADGHAAVLEPGRGARRYLLTGVDTPGEQLLAALRRVTGRRLPALPAPPPLALAAGRAADALQRVLPVRLPLGYEPPYILKSMPPTGTDSSRTREELGVEPPPVERTLADTIAWLVAAGHLSAKAAGRAQV